MAINTVALVDYNSIREEYPAGATITPGNLIQLNSAGQVILHATSGGCGQKMFALENYPQGGLISDTYASGEAVQCWVATPGDVAYSILGTGQTIVVGDLLSSNGNGTLKKYDGGTADKEAIGVALDAVTTTTATANIRVRIV